MLQKISIGLNILLIAAVGGLFYMFNGFKSNLQESGVYNDSLKIATIPLPKGDSRVMYVNIDTLQNKYEYFLKIKRQLEKKANENEAIIKSLYQDFQNTYQKYQQQAPTMTELDYSQAQQELGRMEKNIRDREADIAKAYEMEAKKLNDQYLAKVQEYLGRKSKEHNYSYVLGYVKESYLLYANDSLNITNQVVNGLNVEFKASQKK